MPFAFGSFPTPRDLTPRLVMTYTARKLTMAEDSPMICTLSACNLCKSLIHISSVRPAASDCPGSAGCPRQLKTRACTRSLITSTLYLAGRIDCRRNTSRSHSPSDWYSSGQLRQQDRREVRQQRYVLLNFVMRYRVAASKCSAMAWPNTSSKTSGFLSLRTFMRMRGMPLSVQT
jgi:hypothetical protein